MFVTVLIFGLILGILIFVHELGHFLTAKRNGITSHEFGFGFPPRIFGVVKDAKTGKWKKVWGSKEYYGNNTLYSINLIPLGGFVRIKGESPINEEDVNMDELSDADKAFVKMSTDSDSFSVKSKWVKFKVLIAGVTMNFILAWVLVSIVLMIGAPEPVDMVRNTDNIVRNIGVQIVEVESGSPADEIGLKVGDSVDSVCNGGDCVEIVSADQLKDTILTHKGEEIAVHVTRGKSEIVVVGVPRQDVEQGQGALGISMTETVIVRYSPLEAMWEGLMRVIGLTKAILIAFWTLISTLVTGGGVNAEVAGPVGIAMMTQQMRDLGFVYLLQFAAILSVNLGIINILPIPALDGGRIMFLIIEWLKGSPINQKIENMFHTVFFVALIGLMLVITARDILKLF
ncbi:MAG: M50 family metallopeptidase [Candidatus Moraniibacteriota bacterium]|jgi:regulator of sigma E protease